MLVVGAVVVGVAGDMPVADRGREIGGKSLAGALGVSRLDCLGGGTDGGESREDAGGNGETHGV
jgi:hypothetical protein